VKDSIAIWYEQKSDVDDITTIDLDVNIWLTKKKKDNKLFKGLKYFFHLLSFSYFRKEFRDDYLEFGIRISKYTNLNKIFLYLPYEVSLSEIKDMIPELKDSDTANALFNEKMTVSSGDSSMYEAKYENSTKEQFIASCSELSLRNIEKINGGCILTLEMPTINSFSSILYKRIRINKVEHIIDEYSENNFFIDGIFKKLRTVEISINTTRKLPPSIVDKINNNITLKSINFFLMTDIFTDIVFKSKDIKSSRILEEDIWNKYLGISKSVGKDIKKVIAYQWKVESKIKSKEGICAKDIKGIFKGLSEDEVLKSSTEESTINIRELFKRIGNTIQTESAEINYEPLQDYNLFVKFSMVRKQGLIFALSVLIIILFGIISGYGGNRFTECMDNNCTFNLQDAESSTTKPNEKDNR